MLFYNVVLYFASASSRVQSVMAKIVNPVVEGLNSKERLPKYVLILVDKDLIENLNYFEYGIADVLDDCMLWFVHEINKIFELKHEDLQLKKPGTLSTATEPRVIWTTMITRPTIDDQYYHNIYSKKGKFNKAIEKAVMKFRYHHVMYIESLTESAHFDNSGCLTANGKAKCGMISSDNYVYLMQKKSI